MGCTSSKDAVNSSKKPGTQSLPTKPRLLCLHGTRTSGDILDIQTAFFRANVDIDCVFVDAPLKAVGDPDETIILFFPDGNYFEWYRDPSSTTHDDPISKAQKIVLYDGLEASLEMVLKTLQEKGPFDGLLGFSTGAEIVTRVTKLQEEEKFKSGEMKEKLFQFVVLIGGVEPEDWSVLPDTKDGVSSSTVRLHTPSLHIIGQSDPYHPNSKILEQIYDEKSRTTLIHSEGHNIPSIKTDLYPTIKEWIYFHSSKQAQR
jgi:hypothetical protein